MTAKIGTLAVTLALALSSSCATVGSPNRVQHVVTADQLAKEYNSSELLFQERYDGSYVQLSAKVSSVDKKKRPENPDQPLVNLLTPSEHYEVYLTPKETFHLASAGTVASATCRLSTDHAGWVRTLRNGYTITVRGTLKVESSGFGHFTTLEDCQPVSIDDKGEGPGPAPATPASTTMANPTQ